MIPGIGGANRSQRRGGLSSGVAWEKIVAVCGAGPRILQSNAAASSTRASSDMELSDTADRQQRQ
jgi:hypothetical protein